MFKFRYLRDGTIFDKATQPEVCGPNRAIGGVCQQGLDGYKARILKTHLPSTSPLVRRHHVNWRLRAIERAASVTSREVMFTAPMTLSKADFGKLRGRILDLIQETSEMVKDSPSEEIAYLNIDLLHLGYD